jgi:thiamine monophosphate synthase
MTKPSFFAPSKPSRIIAFAPQGMPRISEWKKKIGKIPLVGIGGITLERATGVLEAGADSAAAVTDITRNRRSCATHTEFGEGHAAV